MGKMEIFSVEIAQKSKNYKISIYIFQISAYTIISNRRTIHLT